MPEEYEKLIEASPAKQRLQELFVRLPLLSQQYFVQKYSGIFNYYDEISEEVILDLCQKLQNAVDEIDMIIHKQIHHLL